MEALPGANSVSKRGEQANTGMCFHEIFDRSQGKEGLWREWRMSRKQPLVECQRNRRPRGVWSPITERSNDMAQGIGRTRYALHTTVVYLSRRPRPWPSNVKVSIYTLTGRYCITQSPPTAFIYRCTSSPSAIPP